MRAPTYFNTHGVRLPAKQRGITLIELMVGIALGLLVIAVAMGALMVSRGISGSVSDAAGIQQQGAYAMRVIGQQLRQAGSLYLNPDPNGDASTDVTSPVVFEILAKAHDGGNEFKQEHTLVGDATSMTTGFRRYLDRLFVADNATATTIGTDYLARNCAGYPGKKADGSFSPDERVESIFTFTNGALRCSGNGATAQPMVQNVAQFQVTYLVQTVTGGTGTTIQYLKGEDIPSGFDWRRVQGVQVCLVLHGTEVVDMPSGSSYTDCGGTSVDITTLTDTTRKNRMHLLYRNTFQLRSQGLI